MILTPWWRGGLKSYISLIALNISYVPKRENIYDSSKGKISLTYQNLVVQH
jgi:hypothetical protein